ncbi:uncharacterized protein RAG0_04146 [Rhynchosporium agropyri]|uniref:Uncharacterized protein n=1 Tax=Rhynchosporium agropyri TaxID=914238 RepID=A0A1E1K7P0_9HELO|nr:uncharacterized protein RAG0_04146 [Rhynchosporium agropyri]
MASYGETMEESDDRKMLVDSICQEYIRLKGDMEFLRDIFQLQEWTRHVIPDNFDEELLLLCYSLEGATGIWEKIGEMEYQRSSEYKLAMMSPWTAKL